MNIRRDRNDRINPDRPGHSPAALCFRFGSGLLSAVFLTTLTGCSIFNVAYDYGVAQGAAAIHKMTPPAVTDVASFANDEIIGPVAGAAFDGVKYGVNSAAGAFKGSSRPRQTSEPDYVLREADLQNIERQREIDEMRRAVDASTKWNEDMVGPPSHLSTPALVVPFSVPVEAADGLAQ
jgi:hypothetical protein